MATKIVTKNSSTASAVPTASDLVQGELAVNVSDKRLFTEDNGGSIVELGTNPSTIDINAGTIDGAVIGGNTPAAITGSTVTSTGNIVVTGTVDGRDVATDGTKLDGIEASADVTDTTNVVASLTAGYNITIAADGTIASTASGGGETLAQTLALGAVTGGTDISVSSGDNIVMAASSTVDGRDVSVDGTKLDGIEASADVTDTANVTAAGALMDSELTSIASVKALNQGVATTDSPAFAGLTVDTTTLAVDSTYNRVGIGTSSPASKLHLADTATVVTFEDTNSTNNSINTITNYEGTMILSVDPNNNSTVAESMRFSMLGAEAMRIDASGNVGIGTSLPSSALDVVGTLTVSGAITEDAVTLTGTSTTIDLATATNFVHDLTGATTYTFSNPSSTGNATAFTLKIIQGLPARAITWPSSVDWAGGTAPTLTAANNGVDVFVFYTINGGSTYYGFTAGQAMA